MPFREQKMDKLPSDYQFFDVNDLWSFSSRWAVRRLYPLPITANQVTFLSLVTGVLSAAFYLSETSHALTGGAVFLYAKLYLDNIDGRLARVRGEVSRFGRFFDSFADWLVTVLVYAAIAIRLVRETGDFSLGFLGAAAALSCFIHCSYYVFYLVHYASIAGTYENNRPDESFTSEDNSAYRQGEFSRSVYCLQRFHDWAYGWQDRLIAGLDRFSRKLAGSTHAQGGARAWYGDKRFLTLASPLCLCTNNMAVVVFSLFNRLDICLALIVGLGNLYWVGLSAWKIARFKLAGRDGVY